jgi:dipeptidyl aminopeptidase/acylaminoacyl peptidase
LDEIQAEWVQLPLGMLMAEAVLAFPVGASDQHRVPIVIVQHGIGSTPETPFSSGAYHEYAKALLKAGFAVLVPMNLRSVEKRNNVERYARLAGTSLPGIELVRLQHLLDIVLADPRVDADNVGMWGVSLGGMATMFWMPLEPRIKAGVVSAWFNERRNKMAVPDGRYSSFSPREDHAFFNGWLTEFSDYDLVSLIAPRPLMIQHGKKDNIAHWPQVVEEYDKSIVHYQKLQIPEKIELIMHDGGHEAIVDEGLRFMSTWLKETNKP